MNYAGTLKTIKARMLSWVGGEPYLINAQML